MVVRQDALRQHWAPREDEDVGLTKWGGGGSGGWGST